VTGEILRPALHVVGELGPDAAAPGLLEAGVDAAYQPIVHLGSGAVIAYEALARPRHPDARSPLAFFDALERAGLRLAGERTAFAAAFRGAGAGLPKAKLFMNASPGTLVDARFDVLELLDLADEHHISAADLVIEVTESEEIDDLEALATSVRRLRRLGIGVAVDDAGAGHASFRVITRLRPSYIKLDRDLVTGVDTDGARHAFVESMVRFARQIGSRLIAEGIETEGELSCLAGLGVEAGQGYFLARPEIGEFASPSAASTRLIGVAANRIRLGAAKLSIRELARPATRIEQHATVGAAYERFAADPRLALLLLDDGGRLHGQVSRRSLERGLAEPGAWDRLSGRDIATVVDHDPLTLLADLDVREVGAIMAARPAHDDADEVVVVDDAGSVVGVVAVSAVLRALAEVRTHPDELNPLSGLPGPAWVEGELARRLAAGSDVTVAVLDVDSFRALNHHGGYTLGDEAIRALARCLTGVTGGVLDAAVAHAGGDDFVLLVPPRGFEELVAETIRSVESEVMPFLRTQLRLHGAGEVAEQLGLSMAGVDVPAVGAGRGGHLDRARDQLTGLVGRAKSFPGYAVVRSSGETIHVSTWEARGGTRTISLGFAEPEVVVGALALIERSWAAWWDTEKPEARAAFPGPRAFVERLLETYAAALRSTAEQALAENRRVVEVIIEGPEDELLEILDRLAIVASSAHRGRRASASPEVALLDRLLRQRARAITRRDTLTRG
jgi:EAL domain-containing protein (putative c-di-GMP-specific phosphodiesterase class I)/GGDEF domain-containing protein/CBS domain-containing protein